ncbi:hypothetical protein B0H16DRAFT_1472469 [Mycena metata]|uniref:Uncharacterized protein n=1 Tax=Mycena metata TaxID=1033252 RepID=A0AAD7HMK9_9AGAR|nr:hypothetical protein B0H16DRAFT_1472469 [Mycena metata]
MPAPPPRDFEIIRSASWWKEFHERKKKRKEREEVAKRPHLELAPGQQQSPLITFVPGRSVPIISVVQNDGSLLAQPSTEPHVACPKPIVIMGSSGCSPHTPLAGGPGPSKHARMIMARVAGLAAKKSDLEAYQLAQLTRGRQNLKSAKSAPRSAKSSRKSAQEGKRLREKGEPYTKRQYRFADAEVIETSAAMLRPMEEDRMGRGRRIPLVD